MGDEILFKLIGFDLKGGHDVIMYSADTSPCTKATWVHPPLDLVNFDK